MTAHETLNQTDEQEIKAWVGQILRPNVANYSGLERWELNGRAIRCHPYFGPWEPEPTPERLVELVALFEAEHPGYTLTFV